jgi:hypothetical protein
MTLFRLDDIRRRMKLKIAKAVRWIYAFFFLALVGLPLCVFALGVKHLFGIDDKENKLLEAMCLTREWINEFVDDKQ